MKTSLVITLALLTIDRLLRAASVGISNSISLEIGSIRLSFGETLHYIDFGFDVVLFGSITWIILFGVMFAMGSFINPKRLMLPVGLIIISMVSNNVDRLIIGAVSDPLMVTTSSGWVAFNLADIVWCIGMGIFLIEVAIGAHSVLLPQKRTGELATSRFSPELSRPGPAKV